MFGLTTANRNLREQMKWLDKARQNALRLTKEQYDETVTEIADLRNALNCLEEKLPHVRP